MTSTKPVVTLAALFGAGGHVLGPRVAERLGGYVAGSARQTPGALDTIRYLTGGATAFFIAVGTVVMLAYPLTEERFRTMIVETAARRSGRATPEVELRE
jgi:Na+/melibiose symporter-like transporter